jgi:hypothetical protein
VQVLTVWQPMLATDSVGPRRWALTTMSDSRVRQYWDPTHLVAKRMAADARAPQPEHECCTRGGVIWDLAAVYPPGATWTDKMPPAVVFNGPVVDIASEIEAALEKRPALIGAYHTVRPRSEGSIRLARMIGPEEIIR